ncbi:unnamed protein product [Didymodactylos carnosus]|uniref:WSC domain-containing protein n=1 Tax=Didymodactylos carnosus TaxID=1234261 RepID=A0A813WQ25_9BILA|nr:unnamed protein product [Didymodactylos carnosus]CAF3648198.1 unnamed protein product [Didymodactylos carnosus]
MKTLFLLYYFVFQLIQRNKGDDNYLGCYIDQVGTRDLDTFIGDELSPTQCITACREQNFTYAGIQFGNECRCGQTYGLYGEVSDGECDYQCTSEEITAKCGGDNRNSVYNVEITTPSDPESDNDCLNNIVGYQGCFEENALEGMLGVVNNIGACITMCSDSIYAGILNGSLCYCGMNIRQSTNLDENECRIPCPTHETTCCGGISLFSIYDVNTYNNATANDSPVLARVRISSYDSSTVILSTSQSSSIIPSSDFNNQNNLSSTNLNTPISASVNPTSISNVINLSSTTATPFIQSYDSSVHSIIATDITPSQHSLAIFDTFSTSLGSAPSTLLSSQNFVGASQFLVSEISLQSTTYSEPTVYQTSITQFSSTIASSTQYSIISTQSSSSQLSGNSETSLHSSTPNQYSTLTFTASSQFFSSEQSSYLGSLLYSTELTPSSTNYLTSLQSIISQSSLMTAASQSKPTISLNQLTESSSLAFTTILSTTNTITLASSSISHEATTFVSSSTLMFDSTIITTSPTITSQAVNTEITASNTYVTSSEQSTSYVSTTTMINSLLSSTSYSSDFTSSTILLSVPSIFPVTSTLSTQTTTLSSQGIVGSTEYITNFTQTSTITTGILNFTQTSTLTSESTTLVPESDIVYSGFNGTFNAKNDTQRTKLNDGLTAIVYLAFCLNNPCNSGRRKRQTNCLLEAVIVNITQPNATADPNYYRVYYYVKNCTTISGLLVYNAISSLPVSLMQAQLTISIPGINLIAAERVQLVVAENTTTSTTSTAPVDKKLWLIGAVLGPIAFVLLLILVFLYLHYKCRPRVKNNMSSAQNYNAIQGRQPTTGVDSLIQSNPLDQNERQRISPPSTKPYDGRVTNVPQFPIPSDIPLHIRESIRSKSDVERWRNKIRMQEKFEKIYQSPLTDLDRLKDVTSSTTVPPLSRPTPRMRTYQYDNPAYNNNQEDLVQMPVRNDEQEYYEKSYAIHSPRRIPRQSEVEVGRTKLHRLLDEVLDKAGDEQLNPDSKSETLKRRRQRRRTRPQENYYGGDSSDPIIEDHEQRRHIPVIAQVTDRPDPNITRLRYNPYEAGDRAAEISRSIPVELHRKYASNNEDVSASPNQTKYSQQTNNTLFNNHTNNLPDRSATSTDAFASAKRVPRTRIETDQEVLMRQNDMRNISDTTRERPRTAVPEDNRRQHMFNSDGVYVDSIKTRFPTNEDDISRKHVSRAWNEDQQQVQRMPLQRPEPSRTDPDARFHLNSYEAGFSNQQPRRNDYKDEYLMAKQSVVSTKNFISSIQGELQSIVGIPPGTDHV